MVRFWPRVIAPESKGLGLTIFKFWWSRVYGFKFTLWRFKNLFLKQIKNEMARIPGQQQLFCNTSQLLRLIIWGVVNNQLLAH